MEVYFKWIGAAILLMLSIVSAYKIINEKELSKNLLTLFLMTVFATLILFGIYPTAVKFFAVDAKFSDKNIKDAENIVTQNLPNTNLIIEIDPSKPEYWTVDSNYIFKWYNAPFGLAIQLGEMNMNNLKILNVKYQILMVEGNDAEGRAEFKRRYTRMQELLIYMKENKTPLDGRIEVRVFRNERFPSISFYLFSKGGKNVANFYIDPLITEAGVSKKAFQTYNESVVNFLDAEFDKSWMRAEKIKLTSLLLPIENPY
jgi:hypothetical protein